MALRSRWLRTEFATVLLEHLLDELGAEAGEAVPVGNHKCEFISAMKSLQ